MVAIANSQLVATALKGYRLPVFIPDGSGNWTDRYMTVEQVLDVIRATQGIYGPPDHIGLATELDTQVRSRHRFQTNTAYPGNSQNIEAALLAFMQHSAPFDITGGGHTLAVLGWNRMYSPGHVNALLIGVEGKPDVGAGIATLFGAFEANLVVSGGGGSQAQLSWGYHFTAASTGGAGVPFVNMHAILVDDLSGVSISGVRRLLTCLDYKQTVGITRGTGANSFVMDLAGNVRNSLAQGATTDTALDILNRVTVPANTLKTNGDRIVAESVFRMAATNNNKAIGMKIGANNTQSGNVGAASNGVTGWVRATYGRVSVGHQTLNVFGQLGTTPFAGSADCTDDETADINVDALAQSAVTGEITIVQHTVDYFAVGA